jgi:hypothetical protein
MYRLLVLDTIENDLDAAEARCYRIQNRFTDKDLQKDPSLDAGEIFSWQQASISMMMQSWVESDRLSLSEKHRKLDELLKKHNTRYARKEYAESKALLEKMSVEEEAPRPTGVPAPGPFRFVVAANVLLLILFLVVLVARDRRVGRTN